ncbi:MAG: YdbH domain-containing protein, partial [Novosphingobium sp.]
ALAHRSRLARLWRALLVLAVIVAVALAVVWTQRERIADNVIARELRGRGIPATYTVERIGGRRQVLRDIVVGDPRRPDLTVERAEVRIAYRVGFPTIGQVTLVRPRLYGTYRRGTLSFGRLDPLIFTGRKKAFELPELDLRLVDGRALLETDYGRLGVKAQGQGKLNNGFAGLLAVAAPELAGFGCAAEGASFYGNIRIRAARPRLAGPLRLGRLTCPQRGIVLERAALRVDTTLDKDVRGAEGTARALTGALAWGDNRAASLAAETRFTYRKQALTLRFDGTAGGVGTPAVAFGRLGSEGTLRAREGFARLEYQGSLTGTGVAFGPELGRSLAGLQASAGETLLAPLLAQLRGAMAREARGSRLSAELDYRQEAGRFTLYMAQANLRGGSGADLLALSRVSLRSGRGAPRFAGNFVTGGPGLPRITGQTERTDEAGTVLRLEMAEYRAGAAALALPELVLTQASDGSLGFAGQAVASGPLPGGLARNLALPLDGSLGSDGTLALFRRCTTLRFDQLAYASLTLERRSVALCPQPGQPILRAGTGGLRLAAGAPSLDLAGRFGQSPVRLVSGPIGFAYPGVISARDVAIALGRAGAPNRFSLARLEGRIGETVSSGRFAGAEARLFATPLDITNASGTWRYTKGRVSVADATLTVTDRIAPARFAPLKADGATLTLVGNRLEANAALRHAASGRPVTRAVLRHDLASGRGSADLAVDDLRFDQGFQPADLTRLALGTIANVRGAVAGTGRIDWSPRGVTSSGTLSTEELDFAAAFGPVRGLSGTVRFTDLLNMVTAPDQEVRIASLNPGIEVSEGVVRFELLRGNIFRLKSAQWPFLGGTLALAPIDLNLGVSEARRYTLI